MKLVFQTSKGTERKIADVENQEGAMAEIKKFCAERDYEIPYIRIWGDDERTCLDCGSWSEMFILYQD